MPDNDLESILEELKNDDSLSSLNEAPSAERIDIDEDNINDYLMQKLGKLVEVGIDTAEDIQSTLSSGFEVDELIAFSNLLATATKAADTLNKINIQNKKAEAAKELKQMDIDKKQLGAGGGNTNILIATREEVIERFLDKNKKYIDTDSTTEEPTDEQRT